MMCTALSPFPSPEKTMNRRQFTKWMGLSAASAAFPLSFGCSPESGAGDADAAAAALMDAPGPMNLDPRSPEGFETPLAVPGHRRPLLRILDRPRALELAAGPLTASIAGVEQDLLAYRARANGRVAYNPVLRVRTGQRLTVDLQNGLSQETIIHWHGLVVDGRNDGVPTDAIAPGASYAYDFVVRNRGGTYWYHPHPYAFTSEQAYYGLASFFIVQDADDAHLSDALGVELGRGDIPIVLQDKRLDANGRIVYAPNEEEWFMGFLGDVVLANLTAKPRLDLETRLYRFRLLNGSNARIYRLAFVGAAGRVPVQLVGNDGGLLESPVEVAELFLAPGERADVVLDLRGARVGEEVFLKSLAFDPMDNEEMIEPMPEPTPGPEPMGIPNGEELYLVKLVVRRRAWCSEGRVPRRLSSIAPVPLDAAVTRPIALSTADMKWFINGARFAPDAFPIEVERGTVEVWEIANDMVSMPHPMHIHGFQFQVLERMMSPPQIAALSGDAGGRLLTDFGWKDTVLVWPGETVKVAIDFSHPFPGEQGYVFHCHNLEHEDEGMMVNYRVV